MIGIMLTKARSFEAAAKGIYADTHVAGDVFRQEIITLEEMAKQYPPITRPREPTIPSLPAID